MTPVLLSNHVYAGGAASWDGACGVSLVLGKDKDKEKKPFHGGEHLSDARTWPIQCLINCADRKRINETQLLILANKVAFS